MVLPDSEKPICMFLFNVLVVVTRGLAGPSKDFQNGPDACVRLTSKPVLSKCSNLRARTSRGALKSALRGALRPILGTSPHSHTFFLSGSE